MKLRFFQVDAFASRPFAGNPAAVVPLERWLDDATLLAIAAENKMAATAFVLGGNADYQIRWMTPTVEVELCGHATLASGFVVMHDLELAFQLFDRIVLMNEGRIVADGPTSEVVHDERLDDVFGVRFARVQRDGAACLQVASVKQDSRSVN